MENPAGKTAAEGRLFFLIDPPPPPSFSLLLLHPKFLSLVLQTKKKIQQVSVVEAEPTKCFIIRKWLIITAWSQAVSSLTQLPCVGWRPPAMCVYVCVCVCVFVSGSLREVRLMLRRIADVLPHTAYKPAGCSVKIVSHNQGSEKMCVS